MSVEAHAVLIQVRWSDGLSQRFERQEDDTWTLTLTGPLAGGPRVTGYRRGDLERVLGRVLADTLAGSAESS